MKQAADLIENEALAQAMRAKGYDPETDIGRVKFAAAIEVAEKTIRNWLGRKGKGPNRNLGKIAAHHLDVEYDDLWGSP